MTLQWFAFCVFSVLLRNASAREHQQHLRSQGPFWDKIVSGVKKAANTVKDAIKGPPPQPPGRAERAEDFFNCDRQCQWFVQEKVPKHKFIDTRVIGKRVAKAGRSFDSKGRFCACWFNNKKKDGTFKNLTPTEEHWIKRTSSKHFDTVRTWSGDKPEDYSSPYVCVAENSGKDTEKRYTMTVEQLESEEGKKRLENKEITPHHCGRCSACSSRKDIEVLAKTREWITEVMTDVSTGKKFSNRFHLHTLATKICFLFEQIMHSLPKNCLSSSNRLCQAEVAGWPWRHQEIEKRVNRKGD